MLKFLCKDDITYPLSVPTSFCYIPDWGFHPLLQTSSYKMTTKMGILSNIICYNAQGNLNWGVCKIKFIPL